MQTASTASASASASRVNLGPLPTVFNPPSDCTSLRIINDNVVFMGAAIGYGCYEVQSSAGPCTADGSNKRDGNLPCPIGMNGGGFGNGVCISVPVHTLTQTFSSATCTTTTSISHHDFSLTQSCYPPNFASSFNPTDYDTSKWTPQPPIYSPGLACPSGYLPMCTIERIQGATNSAEPVTAANANNVIWSMLNDGETAIGCCPSNYACDPNSPHLCISTPPVGDIIAVTNGVSCSSGTAASQSPTALTAEAIRILFVKSSDPTSSLSSSSTNDPSPNNTSGNGRKIAIGVAIPLAVLLIGAMAFYFLRRRKRLREKTLDGENLVEGDSLSSGQKAELPGSIAAAVSGSNGVAYQKPELDNVAITILPELAGESLCNEIQELHGNSIVVTPSDTETSASNLQSLISPRIAREDQQNPVGNLSSTDPSSTSELGLWNWNSFDALSGSNESSEHPATNGHQG